MLGVYIAIALWAVVLVSVFVDCLPRDLRPKETGSVKEAVQLMLATVKHLRHKEMLLLIPLTMYSGFEQALYSAEFSKVRAGGGGGGAFFHFSFKSSLFILERLLAQAVHNNNLFPV